MLSRHARGAGPGAIGFDALSARPAVGGGELLGEVGPLPTVRFIGRAPSELDAGYERVVVLEVLADEGLEPGEGVQLVEVEPAMGG